ncbi:MAG: zinc ribbon domain-containing protein [Myxococcales bacterium]|nr:zinc ribbon domain-containing protein [Myxococcales bacterium]
MPTYNYLCGACGAKFERVQRISEDPIKECPNCGKLEATRQITQGNFILKGGGWYGDLYSGSSNKKGGSLSESSSSSSSTSSTSTASTESSSSTAAAAPAPPPTSTPSSGSSS